jgi:hypothetical protein
VIVLGFSELAAQSQRHACLADDAFVNVQLPRPLEETKRAPAEVMPILMLLAMEC